MRRRLALRWLRPELVQRERNARTLATKAYAADNHGKRGRAWWDGRANALERLIEGKESL